MCFLTLRFTLLFLIVFHTFCIAQNCSVIVLKLRTTAGLIFLFTSVTLLYIAKEKDLRKISVLDVAQHRR